MARSIDNHPTDCTCPPCEQRRAVAAGKVPKVVLTLRVPPDVKAWVADRGGGSWLAEHLAKLARGE